MNLEKYKIFWLNLKKWRMIYGLIMYLSFFNLPFAINTFMFKREFFDFIIIIFWIAYIIISYYFIMYIINPRIEKYGEKAPLILIMFKNRIGDKILCLKK